MFEGTFAFVSIETLPSPFLVPLTKAQDKVKTSMVAELFGIMCFEIKGKINPTCLLGLL